MFCKNCGKEVNDKAGVCVNCGSAVKPVKSKNILKKWWFWVIVAVGVVIIGVSGGGDSSGTENADSQSAVDNTAVVETTYEQVDLKTMFDDLEGNAMKAEEKYQNKYVEITSSISNFDSDGGYISVKATGANDWDFNSVMCYIKNDEQKQFLLEKSVGDTVIIKGKITSIGEVLGYSMNIDDIK